ncbi:MAG TPA: hypothetical protein PKD41_10725 [Solidesulfovibrio sp.]|jgi:hypothetical protein|nr:hypothetical protein [Desulfovibrio sp.]HML61359.1 hypothetical protein [Solidesulfovibrio sp.]
MNPVSFDPAFALLVLMAALFFLLLGWRLGRESAGRPMFDFPLFPAAPQETDAPDETWEAPREEDACFPLQRL